MIKQQGDKYILYTRDGSRILGEHSSYESALSQERAIQASKHASAGQGYISLKVNLQDAKKLHKLLSDNGVTDLIPPDKMHMTLMYDKSNPSVGYEPSKETYSSRLLSIKELGDGDWKAVVLELLAPEVSARHDDLKAQGYTHSYDSFIPHVSVKYKPSEGDLVKIKGLFDKIVEALPNIRLDNESGEPLTDESTKSFKEKLTEDIEKSAMSKLASSKWRQLMYTGNLSDDALSALAKSGIYSPSKLNQGLSKGNSALLKRLGLSVSSGNAWENMINIGSIRVPRNLYKKRLSGIDQELYNVSLRHEIDESRAFLKGLPAGLEARPFSFERGTTRALPLGMNEHGGGHYSPEVLARESANSYTLSPEAADKLNRARLNSRAYSHLQEYLPGSPDISDATVMALLGMRPKGLGKINPKTLDWLENSLKATSSSGEQINLVPKLNQAQSLKQLINQVRGAHKKGRSILDKLHPGVFSEDLATLFTY